MHMSDALLSPLVGGFFLLGTAGLIGLSCKKIKAEKNDHAVPLMGVMGAFVFAAQMINFSIPGTGSSGHLGGGLLLAILLGPWRAFLVMASVLVVQALFFADGGLIALGCNCFNIGFITIFVGYPLWRLFVKSAIGSRKMYAGVVGIAMATSTLGALAVVLQTTISGISDLPFKTFALFMVPIHQVIGLVEGIVTSFVVAYIYKLRPELLTLRAIRAPRTFYYVFIGVTIFTAGLFGWFASQNPDGLEWAIKKTMGKELSIVSSISQSVGTLQNKIALFPEYHFKKFTNDSWLSSHAGQSTAGIFGSLLVVGISLMLGFIFRNRLTIRNDKD